MIDKRWIRGSHFGYNTFWYIASEFKRVYSNGDYRDCYLIIEQDKLFGWVYLDICSDEILENPYTFVDEKDVPENIIDYVSEWLSDPFFEIEAERYINWINH